MLSVNAVCCRLAEVHHIQVLRRRFIQNTYGFYPTTRKSLLCSGVSVFHFPQYKLLCLYGSKPTARPQDGGQSRILKSNNYAINNYKYTLCPNKKHPKCI